MPFRHDANQYTSIPTRTAAGTLSLTRAIIVAAPADPPDPVGKRLANLYSKALALQTAWIDANRPGSGEAPRVADLAVDRSWSAVRSRLQDWVNIEDKDHAARAQELLDLLFPTGLDFLHLPFARQWSESERRMALIAKDGLEADLIDLCDMRFLKRLEQAHAAYGAALEITKKKESETSTTRVIDALRALRTELASYARLLLGLTLEDDDKAVETTEAALEPIIRFRKPRSSSASAEEEEEADEETAAEPIEAPLPEVPSEP